MKHNKTKNKMKIDLLKAIYEKKMLIREANAYMMSAVDNPQIQNWGKHLGMSMNELKAYSAGITNFNILAKWRYEGWPKQCNKCKLDINIKKNQNWYVRKLKAKQLIIYHLDCKINDKN